METERRRPIEEVECSGLDVVLALTFEPRELVNLLGGADRTSCERAALSVVHRAVHDDPAFARRLGRMLDLLHRAQPQPLDGGGDGLAEGRLGGGAGDNLPEHPAKAVR